jgi:subtilisin family serine protease
MTAHHGFHLSFLILTAAAGSALQAQTEHVLIKAKKPYDSMVAAIQQRGGRVTMQYRHFDGLAAEISRSQLESLYTVAGQANVTKDLIVPAPATVNTTRPNVSRTGGEGRILANASRPLSAAAISGIANGTPQAYQINNSVMNAAPLHGSGILGAGVTVAVIDAGIRPGFPHISLDGSVTGCEDFVGDGLGCTNPGNGSHGTVVAGMISANADFAFAPDSDFRNAVLAECPACFSNPPENTIIPMIGTAPLASIYALRIFGPTGGSPGSRILAAMDRVIDLRLRFDAGLPGGANIKVCNMSFGGSTLIVGGGLQTEAVNRMLDADIVTVAAADNSGPASMTVGSPGSTYGALTVGAASLAHNERIWDRMVFGPAIGSLYRPFLGTQTANFSSRGPNADGRPDPDVMANGVASFGQGDGSASSISFDVGTSFAAPSVAGVAALLRQAVPAATARQVRNAIIATANPAVFGEGSTSLDYGAGYVDALAARNSLERGSGGVSDSITAAPIALPSVALNIERNSALSVREGPVLQTASNLKPGQRSQILYRVVERTRQVTVTLSNFVAALPPASQNQLFGDDSILTVHSAKTSEIGLGDYLVYEFIRGGTFTIHNPEPGIMRITLSGSWTNAGAVSADITVISAYDPVNEYTSQGRIRPGQLIATPLTIPAGTSKAEFRLEWRGDWASYPSNDLDLILIRPNNTLVFGAATLNSPETLTITNPAAGVWTMLVNGFEVNTKDDEYQLRVALDGKVVH